MLPLDPSAALPRCGRKALGGHAPRFSSSVASSLAAWRLTQYCLLLVCKLALVLAIAQAPYDVSSVDAAEVARKATEECRLSEARFEAVGRQARERCCPFTLPQVAPFSVGHRSDSRAHALGHRFWNGLLAPLRC